VEGIVQLVVEKTLTIDTKCPERNKERQPGWVTDSECDPTFVLSHCNNLESTTRQKYK
jgi:hypothetical protein